MIAYDLLCANGHRFEGWFEDLAAYEAQQAEGLIICPVCSGAAVTRVPSAFAIRSAAAPPDASQETSALKGLGKQIIDYINKNFDNVGADFAKEALKMHYGVTEARNIRGVSSEAEEKMLRDEGVPLFKIPLPKPSPENKN